MTATAPPILTVGHSTRSWEDFVAMLRAHDVEQLADVRAFPGSRRYPHFNREPMTQVLEREGIAYLHLPELGGRRRARPGAPPSAWRNAGFAGYADYMTTPDFDRALDRLVSRAAERRTAIMCSEAVPWRCHRTLIADALSARGIPVLHLVDRDLRAHTITKFATIADGRVSYATPGARQLEAGL